VLSADAALSNWAAADVLVVVDEDVWIEVGLQLPEFARLLSRQDSVVTIGVVIGHKLAL
jgi:hypothetical protein